MRDSISNLSLIISSRKIGINFLFSIYIIISMKKNKNAFIKLKIKNVAEI